MAARGTEGVQYHLELTVTDRARLTTSSGGELWVYSITLPVLTSTQQITWSGIKTLHR